jgi:hypothetical protein
MDQTKFKKSREIVPFSQIDYKRYLKNLVRVSLYSGPQRECPGMPEPRPLHRAGGEQGAGPHGRGVRQECPGKLYSKYYKNVLVSYILNTTRIVL